MPKDKKTLLEKTIPYYSDLDWCEKQHLEEHQRRNPFYAFLCADFTPVSFDEFTDTLQKLHFPKTKKVFDYKLKKVIKKCSCSLCKMGNSLKELAEYVERAWPEDERKSNPD